MRNLFTTLKEGCSLTTPCFSEIYNLLSTGITWKPNYAPGIGEVLPYTGCMGLYRDVLVTEKPHFWELTIKYVCMYVLYRISRNLLTIYHKYYNLIGYHTHYLSGDRVCGIKTSNSIWRPFPAFQKTFRKKS